MIEFINNTLMGFRSSFSRRATFEWFVVIVAGLMVRTDYIGVTSIIRGLYLSVDYISLIGFFRSSAWTLTTLTSRWCNLIKENAPLVKHDDAVVIVGDGVKQAKEGRRMPGVNVIIKSRIIRQKQSIYGVIYSAVLAYWPKKPVNVFVFLLR